MNSVSRSAEIRINANFVGPIKHIQIPRIFEPLVYPAPTVLVPENVVGRTVRHITIMPVLISVMRCGIWLGRIPFYGYNSSTSKEYRTVEEYAYLRSALPHLEHTRCWYLAHVCHFQQAGVPPTGQLWLLPSLHSGARRCSLAILERFPPHWPSGPDPDSMWPCTTVYCRCPCPCRANSCLAA